MEEFSQEELEEVLGIFQEESEEQIQKLNENLLRLEVNPKDEKAIQEIFREAHSLKGSARMIGLDDIQTIAHKLEDIFGLVRKGELDIKAEVIDILCTAVDSIASIIQDTIKTKGTHSIDVESVVTQLKLIETGEIYSMLGSIPKDKTEQREEPEEEDEDLMPIDFGFGMKTKQEPSQKVKETAHKPEKKPDSLEESILEDIGQKLGLKSSLEISDNDYDISQEDFSEEELLELKRIFYAEGKQHINYIFESIERLKHFPYDREVLSEVYRAAHSLEGSAKVINFVEIKQLAYSIRYVFEQASKEEIFINSDILATIETYLKKVKTIIDENYNKEGYDVELDLEQLKEQIEKKMEVYRKKEAKPRKTQKTKISLTSETLNFDEEDVLRDLGVKQNLEKEKPKKLEPSKQLEIDPLSLSEEELGDLEIGSLKGVVPVVDVEPEEDLKEQESNALPWHLAQKSKPVIKDKVSEKETIEELINELNDHLNILSHNINNKNIINKAYETIAKIKDYAVKENKQEFVAIITKMETLFTEAKEEKITLTSDMAIVMAQSLESAKFLSLKITEDAQDIIEDPSLIYQRLMILHQTARLSAGIPFEEETEPEIFQSEKHEEEKVSEPLEDRFLQVQEQFPKALDKTAGEMFKPKVSVSPVGQMSKDAEPAADSTESYTIKTLRVDTRKLDQLVAQVGELIIAKIKAKERLTDVEKLINLVEKWQRDWAKTKYAVKNLDKKPLKATLMAEGTSIYTPGKDMHAIVRSNSDMLTQLTNNLNVLYRNIQEDDTRLTLIINELEDRIKNVRLLPLTTIFNMFPRMVRDIARQQNKEIELEIYGSETTVDKKIIEEIKSPLMHLIRNSIDHGIESPGDRTMNGKQAVGKVILSARHLENSVLIEIVDDGRGIDLEAIKNKVIEKELLTASELSAMTETQIMNIIFWPGFSTGKEVTDLSGRGVGMDVVHTKITQLNGKVKVKSKLGEGCKVSIQLPVTMATIQVFLVSLMGQTYAIPTSAIKTAALVRPDEIFYKEGRQSLLVDGVPVFLSKLAELLELPKPQESEDEKSKKEKLTVLVLHTDDTNIGLIVDGLLGDQEILHKNLEPPLIRVRNVAGVTTLGSGEVCLILNVGDLAKTAQMNAGMAIRSSYKKKELQTQKKDILVVDDSVTTRILERNILRAAGYNVTVAVNGLDALTKLSSTHFDLVVSDVEMPDISGFELTRRIKTDQMFTKIPVVLVTSLASELDRQKGMTSGASAYITKGSFDQEELLGTIRRLLA